MDKIILSKWLSAGYMEKNVFYPTEEGTPQGGIISPTILNLTLSGLEHAIAAVTNLSDKVHTIIYADDFVVSAANKHVLEQKVKPVIARFLEERGLTLSKEKSKITHIQDGFNFLGFKVI